MNTLYLAPEEIVKFNNLSPELKEGWNVVEEKLIFEEDSELEMRRMMFKLEESFLDELNTRVQVIKSIADFEDLKKQLGNIPHEILANILFTMGIKQITSIIEAFISYVKDDDDVMGLAEIVLIRRMLLESNS